MITKPAPSAAGAKSNPYAECSGISDPGANAKDRLYLSLILLLGLVSAAIVGAYHNVADGDLWAKLSLGAHVWERQGLPDHDIFAFTPILPKYVDHEWGAGTIFYGLLRVFGPGSLLVFKIILFCSTLLLSVMAGRRRGSLAPALLLAIPGALCLLPGYVPVIRSHALTFFFFALTLWFLEKVREGERWPAVVIAATMVVWTNVHGGFVAGLGLIGVYAVCSWIENKQRKVMLALLCCSGLATLINPYGPLFWQHLLPALVHPRPMITEWAPLPLLGWDAFIGFRILFLIVVMILILAWRRTAEKSWPGLIMLAITCYLAWRSRRHAPFFAITAVAVAAPYCGTALAQVASQLRDLVRIRLRPLTAVAICYCAVAFFVVTRFPGQVSLHVLAPVRTYPVREVDILSLAAAQGNVAVPFSWGSYVSWRLYPKVKVSIDGRYEAVYPETTFLMNESFFRKSGPRWEALLQSNSVDFVILDLTLAPLRPADLKKHGFEVVWYDEPFSALLARGAHVPILRQVARDLPPTTIEPVDASVPKRWLATEDLSRR